MRRLMRSLIGDLWGSIVRGLLGGGWVNMGNVGVFDVSYNILLKMSGKTGEKQKRHINEKIGRPTIKE